MEGSKLTQLILKRKLIKSSYRFLDPIINGRYPYSMQEIVNDRLPLFSDEESRMVKCSIDHSHRIRGRNLVPRPGNAVPIRGSGSKRISVSFKVGSRPGLKGVAAPLFADLIGIRRLRTVDWCGFC